MANKNSPTVLVTGVNGYIASAAVLQFINAGFRVRGTVRSLSRTKLVEPYSHAAAFKPYIDAGVLELVEVPNLAALGAWDEAVKGVHGIASVAAPWLGDSSDLNVNLKDAAAGITGLLQAAEKHAGPNLKTVALLSSMVTMLNMEAKPGYRYTGDEFNEGWIDMALAAGPNPPLQLVYSAIKVQVEKSFWAYFNNPARKSTFAGASINPGFVFGPITLLPDAPSQVPPGVRFIWYIYGGGAWPAELPLLAFVDVRDVGRALVFAVQEPSKVSGQRFLLVAHKGSWQATADELREAFPERRDRIRAGTPGVGYTSDHTFGPDEILFDGSRFEEVSGGKYIPYRESIVDSAASFGGWLDQGLDKALGDEVPLLN